ncbi:MAG TPA: hypothetical protein VKA32_00285, partial [Gammaproteobacteria bacterium]|nr:hypothetical protein [Gammaproteobacteria bacterium]
LFSRLEPAPLNTKPPEDVSPLWIDRDTGLLAAAHCKGAVRLPYLDGSAPDGRADCVDTRSAVERAGDWVEGWFH